MTDKSAAGKNVEHVVVTFVNHHDLHVGVCVVFKTFKFTHTTMLLKSLQWLKTNEPMECKKYFRLYCGQSNYSSRIVFSHIPIEFCLTRNSTNLSTDPKPIL